MSCNTIAVVLMQPTVGVDEDPLINPKPFIEPTTNKVLRIKVPNETLTVVARLAWRDRSYPRECPTGCPDRALNLLPFNVSVFPYCKNINHNKTNDSN